MTSIQKRFLFCACGGAIGATLAFEFQAWWWLISAISALTGWISADYAGFLVGCRQTYGKAKSEISAKFKNCFGHTMPNSNAEMRSLKIRDYTLGAAFITILVPQVFLATFLVCTTIDLTVFHRAGQVFLLSPLQALANATITGLQFGFGLGITVAVLSAHGLRNESKEYFEKDIAQISSGFKYLNPLFWVPFIPLTVVKFTARHLKNLIRLVHSDERAVYAICFTAGTIAGFIAGRSLELPHLGRLTATLVGALTGFGLAWLDWKILSLRLGWRTIKS